MKRLCLALLTVLSSWGASADVTVTNLAVAQRPGTKLVDITYAVFSTRTNAVNIEIAVSNGTLKVAATNLSGDVGYRVTTGPNKRIVWNMGTDWKTNVAPLSFTVFASDGPPDSAVPKTGQTVSYLAGDDGDLEIGVAWPDPRFTVVTIGTAQTVVDNLTGLEWIKEPQDYHLPTGHSSVQSWDLSIDLCNNLVYANRSDWRLPSRKELLSLVDFARFSPALPSGHPFVGIKSSRYWTSTSSASSTNHAWFVSMDLGEWAITAKDTSLNYLWPVRGGQ
jgi:hypothetical protein